MFDLRVPRVIDEQMQIEVIFFGNSFELANSHIYALANILLEMGTPCGCTGAFPEMRV